MLACEGRSLHNRAVVRVLFLTHQYFPRHVGGTEMVVRGMVRWLRANGHEAAVLTYVECGSTREEDQRVVATSYEGAKLWEVHGEIQAAEHPALAEYHHPPHARSVVQVAREYQPHVVHAVHVMKLGGAVIPALSEAGFPVVVTLCDYWALCTRHTLTKPDGQLCASGPDHARRCLFCAQVTHGFAITRTPWQNEPELWAHADRVAANDRHPEKRFRRDVEVLAGRADRLREDLLAANRILAISSHQKERFVQHGYPEHRIAVRPLGIESALLADARAQRQTVRDLEGPRKIVFMGSLSSFKGPHLLVAAMRQIPEVQVQLVLHGAPGPDAAYVTELEAAASQDARITLAGVVPPDQMGTVFQGAAALAFPTLWWANDPLVVKAALYCGVPVALHDLAPLDGLVRTPECGWRIPSGEVTAWAAWIKEIATGPIKTAPPQHAPSSQEEFAAFMLAVYGEVREEEAQMRISAALDVMGSGWML